MNLLHSIPEITTTSFDGQVLRSDRPVLVSRRELDEVLTRAAFIGSSPHPGVASERPPVAGRSDTEQ